MNRLFGIFTASLLFSSLAAIAQDTAKDDMKKAGHDTKQAAKDTGKGIKKGTKKAVNKSAKATKKGAIRWKRKRRGPKVSGLA